MYTVLQASQTNFAISSLSLALSVNFGKNIKLHISASQATFAYFGYGLVVKPSKAGGAAGEQAWPSGLCTIIQNPGHLSEPSRYESSVCSEQSWPFWLPCPKAHQAQTLQTEQTRGWEGSTRGSNVVWLQLTAALPLARLDAVAQLLWVSSSANGDNDDNIKSGWYRRTWEVTHPHTVLQGAKCYRNFHLAMGSNPPVCITILSYKSTMTITISEGLTLSGACLTFSSREPSEKDTILTLQKKTKAQKG